MHFATFAILFGAALAAPTPDSSIPSFGSTDGASRSGPSHSSHSDDNTVKISEIRVKKHGWPLRMVTSVEARIKWGEDETNCTAYRDPTNTIDHCDKKEIEFHLTTSSLSSDDTGTFSKIVLTVRKKKDDGNTIQAQHNLPHKGDEDPFDSGETCEHHLFRGMECKLKQDITVPVST